MRETQCLRNFAPCVMALLVAACGGGGGSSPPGSGPNPPSNRAPNILVPMRSQRVIAGRPVQLELLVTPIFSDPDGDPLTIRVDWDFQSGTPGTWNGLRIVDDQLLGADMYVHGNCGHCHGGGDHTNHSPANNGLDAQFTDAGAGDGEFRTASLRNIAVTGPYMHDGRFATLREVIDHYDSGVKASAQLSFLLRDHLGAGSDFPRRLNMTEEQKQALEAFLNTFTDDELLNDPKFSDPFQ